MPYFTAYTFRGVLWWTLNEESYAFRMQPRWLACGVLECGLFEGSNRSSALRFRPLDVCAADSEPASAAEWAASFQSAQAEQEEERESSDDDDDGSQALDDDDVAAARRKKAPRKRRVLVVLDDARQLLPLPHTYMYVVLRLERDAVLSMLQNGQQTPFYAHSYAVAHVVSVRRRRKIVDTALGYCLARREEPLKDLVRQYNRLTVAPEQNGSTSRKRSRSLSGTKCGSVNLADRASQETLAGAANAISNAKVRVLFMHDSAQALALEHAANDAQYLAASVRAASGDTDDRLATMSALLWRSMVRFNVDNHCARRMSFGELAALAQCVDELDARAGVDSSGTINVLHARIQLLFFGSLLTPHAQLDVPLADCDAVALPSLLDTPYGVYENWPGDFMRQSVRVREERGCDRGSAVAVGSGGGGGGNRSDVTLLVRWLHACSDGGVLALQRAAERVQMDTRTFDRRVVSTAHWLARTQFARCSERRRRRAALGLANALFSTAVDVSLWQHARSNAQSAAVYACAAGALIASGVWQRVAEPRDMSAVVATIEQQEAADDESSDDEFVASLSESSAATDVEDFCGDEQIDDDVVIVDESEPVGLDVFNDVLQSNREWARQAQLVRALKRASVQCVHTCGTARVRQLHAALSLARAANNGTFLNTAIVFCGAMWVSTADGSGDFGDEVTETWLRTLHADSRFALLPFGALTHAIEEMDSVDAYDEMFFAHSHIGQWLFVDTHLLTSTQLHAALACVNVGAGARVLLTGDPCCAPRSTFASCLALSYAHGRVIEPRDEWSERGALINVGRVPLIDAPSMARQLLLANGTLQRLVLLAPGLDDAARLQFYDDNRAFNSALRATLRALADTVRALLPLSPFNPSPPLVCEALEAIADNVDVVATLESNVLFCAPFVAYEQRYMLRVQQFRFLLNPLAAHLPIAVEDTKLMMHESTSTLRAHSSLDDPHLLLCVAPNRAHHVDHRHCCGTWDANVMLAARHRRQLSSQSIVLADAARAHVDSVQTLLLPIAKQCTDQQLYNALVNCQIRPEDARLCSSEPVLRGGGDAERVPVPDECMALHVRQLVKV